MSPSEFMRRVVPWPEPGENGWINTHYQFVPKDRQADDARPLPWTGRPFQTLVDFMGYVNWLNGHPTNFKNIYYCLSRQAQTNGYSNGKPKVKRDAKLATHLKAIWLDVDVKAPPKGYATVDEAGRAVLQFVQAAGLPQPSAFVKSGGGLHVYWISDKPLTTEEWRPYAEGLKALAIKHGLRCDAGLTGDAARVLRVPGTLNFKETTPREVLLHYLDPKDIDFAAQLSHISVQAPVVTAAVTAATPQLDFSKIVVAPLFKATFDPDDNLSKGIERVTLLDWKLVERDCPFFKATMADHGKVNAQPLWHLAVLASTFFDGGETLAHDLSNGYAGYTVEETATMYARKVKDRADKNLGWPSCAKIEGDGCTACAGCPFKGKIKSPLELGRVHPTPAPHVNASTSPASVELCLPDDGRYFVDEAGYICEQIAVKSKGGNVGEVMQIRLFYGRITDPVPTADPDFGIDFTVTTDIKTTKPVSLKLVDLKTGPTLAESLLRQGCKFDTAHEPRLKGFFMSWINALNNRLASQKTRAFGWLYDDKGARNGFSYGGIARYIDGRVERAMVSDSTVRRQYSPCGSTDAWLNALSLVTAQKRPQLEMIVATAFATPILFATGETGGSLGFWSESATNKSTAVKLALAVWGHPKLTKLSPDTTERSLEQRLGVLNCLPAVIDDFQDHDQFAKATKLLFMVTQENTRGRLTQAINQREQFEWKTMVVATANASFTDFMIDTQKIRSNAGLFRLLEITMSPIADGTPGRVYKDQAGALLGALEQNFGKIGDEYIDWVVKNLDYVETYTRNLDRALQSKVAMKDGERFWVSAMATTLAGAHFANVVFNCGFDVEAMQAEFLAQYFRNRQKLADAQVEGQTEGAVEQLLAQFLTRYYGNQLWTENVPGQGGKAITVNWLKAPRPDLPVYVQWCIEDRMVRILKSQFVDFCLEKKHTLSSVYDGLKKHYKATLHKKFRLGGYTPWKMAPNTVIEIPIRAMHPLEQTLFENSPPEKLPEHVRLAREQGLVADVLVEDVLAAGQAQAARDLETVLKAA